MSPRDGTFDLGSDKLLSNPSNPGSGKVAFERVAPAITFGWGHIATRGDRRCTIPVELGVVFSRAPTATLGLGGRACLQNRSSCQNITTEPVLQADVRQEEGNLNDDLSVFKLISVISFGFDYRF